MSTRSSARNLFPPLDNPELTIQRRSRANPTLLNDFEMAAEGNGDPPSIIVNGVTNDALRLYLFHYSLTHHATAWFDCLLRNSINTFEQIAKMFLRKYFTPSMVTKLRNENTNFRQRLDESLFKAWERYKLSIDQCLNHNMFPVTQIDTFYSGLTLRLCDTINATAGGTFMKRPLKAEMAKINKNLMRVLQVNQQVKAVTPKCENLGGPHSYNDCPATVGQTQNIYAAGAYQGNSYQPQVVDFDVVPRVPLILGRSFLKTERALIDVFNGELTLYVGREAITFNLDQTSRYSEGDILLFEAFLNDDPSLPPPTQGNYLPQVRKELKIYEAKTDKSSIDEPSEAELKDLPPHLEYVFLEGDDKLPVIIAKDLSNEEKAVLITVLTSHKRVLTWKLFDIKGIDPEFCTHKIPMEDDLEPAVQHQRRVNLKIHDVIKKEIAQPMTRLLKKDTSFFFFKECVEAFQTLKRKLTEAQILIAPDWDLPFELMCDASDFAIVAVLGQRQEKHFRPICYASKRMTEAKSNYTTTEKEMLAVVYAFEKF
nr:hypothetical protein [Tanacetum cinerariifolium]